MVPRSKFVLNIREAAEVIGVSEAQVRSLMKHGRLRAWPAGKRKVITRPDAEAYRDNDFLRRLDPWKYRRDRDLEAPP